MFYGNTGERNRQFQKCFSEYMYCERIYVEYANHKSAEQSYFVHTTGCERAKRTAAIKKPQIQPQRPKLKLAHASSTATLTQLQAHCRDLGLNTTGKKAVMQRRLAECTSPKAPVSGQRGTRRSGVQKNEVRIQLGSIRYCVISHIMFLRDTHFVNRPTVCFLFLAHVLSAQV